MDTSPVARLETAIHALIPLIPELELAITGCYTRPQQHTGTSRRTSSPVPSRPPWQPLAAYALTTIYHDARTMRATLRRTALGIPPHHRFPATAHRAAADLEAIPHLASHPRIPRPLLAQTATTATTWRTAAEHALGITAPWTPIPRTPHTPPPRCPYCSLPSLRFHHPTGRIRCTSPACTDHTGARPQARITYAPDRSTPGAYYPLITWRDGTEGLITAPQQQAS